MRKPQADRLVDNRKIRRAAIADALLEDCPKWWKREPRPAVIVQTDALPIEHASVVHALAARVVSWTMPISRA
jgi:hypothetical protein